MPLYEYHCRKCGENFEVRQRFSDDPLTVHEACGGELEKLLSPPAFQFKGTGWYVTDYGRHGNSTSEPKGHKSSETKSEHGKTEPTTSVKPAADAKPAADK